MILTDGYCVTERRGLILVRQVCVVASSIFRGRAIPFETSFWACHRKFHPVRYERTSAVGMDAQGTTLKPT